MTVRVVHHKLTSGMHHASAQGLSYDDIAEENQ